MADRRVVGIDGIEHRSIYGASGPAEFEKGLCQTILDERTWRETAAQLTCFACIGLEADVKEFSPTGVRNADIDNLDRRIQVVMGLRSLTKGRHDDED
jgi:hypothetical protein